MTILAALEAYYERLEARDEVPPIGYSTEKIHFALVLNADGSVRRMDDLRQAEGKKAKLVARPLRVPAAVKRTRAVAPNLMWDNTKYVLGIGIPKDRSGLTAYLPNHAAFVEANRTLLTGVADAGLQALLRFLDRPPLDPDALPDWWRAEAANQNMVFLMAEAPLRPDAKPYLHDRPEVKQRLAARRADAQAPQGVCLVTGQSAPIARLHPTIKGVWGAQPSGASLVSFNLAAFESYGMVQGENAPVSEAAAFAYGTALNTLLDRANPNRVQVADASVVFWADASRAGEANAAAAEMEMRDRLNPSSTTDDVTPDGAEGAGALDRTESTEGADNEQDDEDDDLLLDLQPPPPEDRHEAAKLRPTVEQIAVGRAAALADPKVESGTRFYILGLSPNSARLSVRFWLDTTVGHLRRHFEAHARDLAIAPEPQPLWKVRPSISVLVRETALGEEADRVLPQLGGEVARAVLTGGRYPMALLGGVILRLRAGDPVTGLKAAICKACINRAIRVRATRPEDDDRDEAACQPAEAEWKKEEVPVSLDRENENVAYRMGRLFAVLENVQRAALGRVNASIRDRYFGAASATPAGVFPLLLRGANHHLAVLRKRSDGGGLAIWFETEIGEILNGVPPDLPRHFTLMDQGRFAVGYYHQRTYRKTAGAPDEPAAETDIAHAET